MRPTRITPTYSTVATLTSRNRKSSQIHQQIPKPTLQISLHLQRKTHNIVIKSVARGLSTGPFLLSQCHAQIPTVVSTQNSPKLSTLVPLYLSFSVYSLAPRSSIGQSIILIRTYTFRKPVRIQDLGIGAQLPDRKFRYSQPVLSTWALILSRIQDPIRTENTYYLHIYQSTGTGKSSAISMSVHLALQQTQPRANGSTN